MAAIGGSWNTASWISSGGWAAGTWGDATIPSPSTGTSMNRLRVILMRLKKRREQQRAALLRRRGGR